MDNKIQYDEYNKGYANGFQAAKSECEQRIQRLDKQLEQICFYAYKDGYREGYRKGCMEFGAKLDIIQTYMVKADHIIKDLFRKINKNK